MRFIRTEHVRLLWRNRQLVPRIARDYLKALSRRDVLRGVELAITYRCNEQCPHCCVGTLRDDARTELSPAEIECAVKELMGLGLLNLNLTGGEPLLREDLPEILGRLRNKGVFLTMGTNGSLLGPDLARELARSGVRGLSISLDAPVAEAHDRIRGLTGAFDAAIAAARYAREAGLLVFFCTIATRGSVASGWLGRVADLALEMGFIVTINYPVLTGRWSGAASDAAILTPDECDALDGILARPGVRWEGSSNFFADGCPAGGEKIYLTPYGDVMPCAAIHAIYGNVREESLARIYARIRSTPVFRCHHARCLAGASGPFHDRVLGEINRAVAEGPAGMRRSAERLETLDPYFLKMKKTAPIIIRKPTT